MKKSKTPAFVPIAEQKTIVLPPTVTDVEKSSDMNVEFLSHSEAETENFASNLAKKIYDNGYRAVAFYGDLGAGKTAFTRGLCRGAGYKGEVTSPTFAIMHEYLGGDFPVYHFDMYRVIGEDGLYSCGFFDYVDTDALLVIEWSENISEFFPENTLKIEILRGKEENDRIIKIG